MTGNIQLGIVHTIAALNCVRPADDQLSTEVVGISDSHGLTEHLAVCSQRGEPVAVGYSEAALLANLEALWAEAVSIKGLNCIFHGHTLEFVRNVYGDEIIDMNYARSVWRCSKCRRFSFLPELHNEVGE